MLTEDKIVETVSLKEVFISYSRLDKDKALKIFEVLKQRGIAVWYDKLIEPGENWREAIVEQLKQSRVMLVLISAHSQKSNELKKELAIASAEAVPLLGIRLEDIKLSGAFAYELTGLNWFDIFDEPPQRYIQLADFLEKLLKNPIADTGSVETMIRGFGTGQQTALPWYKRILYNNFYLVSAFFIVSTIQFLLYESFTSAIEKLTDAQIGTLTAFLNVTIVVTIGSPILLLSVLKAGLSSEELPLFATSLINTVLLILLIRSVVIWIYKLFSKAKKP